MKRPPQDPDEEGKDPTTSPCADPPVWPPAEDAEVTLFTIPGKPMPWASVIDVRSASRLQISGFDPPLFVPSTPPPLPSPALEAAPVDPPSLPDTNESVAELILNAQPPGLAAATEFDLDLPADDDDALGVSLLDAFPSASPEDGMRGWRWWAAFSGRAAASASRIWSTARCRLAKWQAAALQATLAGRKAASRAWSPGGGRVVERARLFLARQRAAIDSVRHGATVVRARLVSGWMRARAGQRSVLKGLSRMVAIRPRLVAATAAWTAIVIRASVSARAHMARSSTAVAILAVQKRRQLRMTAVAAASFGLAFSGALIVLTLFTSAQKTRPISVDGTLAARPITGVAGLAPPITRRAVAVVPEARTEAAPPTPRRVEPTRPATTLVTRRMVAEATGGSVPPPVARDAVPANLSAAAAEGPRNTLVPAPFPTPREDASRASRTEVARIDLSPPPAERSGDRPVPAPFPTPRADPPRADSDAVPGDLAASDGIAEALKHLELAYQRRDASLAKAVWPSVNERALARAFDGLRSQSVTFDGCKLDVSGAVGDVECRGVTTYVPRVGSQDRRTEFRRWKFRMQKGADSWLILSAAAR